jgi:membrane-bound lytic murein transglycosylase MltF
VSARIALVLAVLLPGLACGRHEEPRAAASAVPSEPAPAATPPQATPEPAPEETAEPAPEPTPLPAGIAPLMNPFTGDLDGMIKRRLIRVLTVQSPINYFVDKGRELGITYETAMAFEKRLNEKLGNKVVLVHVVMIPVGRDEMIPRLLKGQGDIAAAALTVTEGRRKEVDFSAPFATDVKEVLVTGPGVAPLTRLEDFAGREIHVRASSSYAEHLKTLSARLVAQGLAPIRIEHAPEVLEDGDILEMVNAGLLPATVVDSFMADFWKQVFGSLTVHDQVALNTGGEIAWAFRKNSPKLAEALDAFVKQRAQGTLAGNVLINKYLKSTKWVRNSSGQTDLERFRSMIDVFKKYSSQYSFDWLLMAAQAYQESQLDQTKRSRVGAIGVMQVMPTTARDKAVNIPDIDKLESNIHAGIKYNRWMVDNFYNEPAVKPLDRTLFAFAAYNAGPGNVARLRKQAAQQGLDPNRWFNNVELVAAKRIGRETVQYVSNIYKYYLAYQLLMKQNQTRAEAKHKAASG